MRILALASTITRPKCKIVARPLALLISWIMRVSALLSFVAFAFCKCETRSPFREFLGLRCAFVAVLAFVAPAAATAQEMLARIDHFCELVCSESCMRESAQFCLASERETAASMVLRCERMVAGPREAESWAPDGESERERGA